MFDNWKTIETIWGGSLVFHCSNHLCKNLKEKPKKNRNQKKQYLTILALTRQAHQVMIFQKRNRQRDHAVTNKYVYKKCEFMEKNPHCSAARSKFPKSGIRRFKSEG